MGYGKNDRTPPWYPFWDGRSWRFDFYVEGVRFRRSTGVRCFASSEIAVKVAQGVYDGAWERALSPFPTFRDAAELYLQRFGENEQALRSLVNYFGQNIRVDEIHPYMIDQAIVDLTRPTWKSENTARRQIVTPAMAVINFALGKRPRRWALSRRERFLFPEEVELLLGVATEPERADLRDPKLRLLKLIAFELGSGATPGETHLIRAEDCNWHSHQVWIRGKEAGGRKTEFRQRWVDLPDRTRELMGEMPRDGRVFITPTGCPIKTDGEHGTHLIRQLHALCDAAGLRNPDEIVFYTFRHTWATWFAHQVGDLSLLILRGGWSDADMALHYTKQAPRDLSDRLLAHGWDFRT